MPSRALQEVTPLSLSTGKTCVANEYSVDRAGARHAARAARWRRGFAEAGVGGAVAAGLGCKRGDESRDIAAAALGAIRIGLLTVED